MNNVYMGVLILHNFMANAPILVLLPPANILIFSFSAIRRDIDLKFIQDTYRVVFNAIKKLTFIDQRSRSQGRYFAL